MKWENVMKTAVRTDGTLCILNQLDLFDQDKNYRVQNSWKFKMKIYYDKIRKTENFFSLLKPKEQVRVKKRTQGVKVYSTRYDRSK